MINKRLIKVLSIVGVSALVASTSLSPMSTVNARSIHNTWSEGTESWGDDTEQWGGNGSSSNSDSSNKKKDSSNKKKTTTKKKDTSKNKKNSTSKKSGSNSKSSSGGNSGGSGSSSGGSSSSNTQPVKKTTPKPTKKPTPEPTEEPTPEPTEEPTEEPIKEESKPTIEFSGIPEGEVEAFTLNITAYDEKCEITEIVLPDGSVVEGNVADYNITQNGVYTVGAINSEGVQGFSEIEITNIVDAVNTDELQEDTSNSKAPMIIVVGIIVVAIISIILYKMSKSLKAKSEQERHERIIRSRKRK